jgi:hypothetical protein
VGVIHYTAAKVVPNPTLEKALLRHVGDVHYCEKDPARGLRYFYNAVDLNMDGIPETVVYLVGSAVCGSGGCPLLIFQARRGQYTLRSRIVLATPPLLVSHKTTHGWRDLILYVAGSGMKDAYHRLQYTGSTYPANPSLTPVLQAGTVISGDAYLANDIAWHTPAPVILSPGCAAPGSRLLLTEGFGALHLNLEEKHVVRLLGAPTTKGPRVLWEGDALYHQTWRYPAQGITLDMVAQSGTERLTIAGIRIGLSSTLKTARGIGIGDSYADVENKYALDKDEAHTDPPFTFVAGSLYGGVIFSFENNKVTQIFLGKSGE